MNFIVRKMTATRNGRHCLTLVHEATVQTTLGAIARRITRYVFVTTPAVALNAVVDIALDAFDEVRRPLLKDGKPVLDDAGKPIVLTYLFPKR